MTSMFVRDYDRHSTERFFARSQHVGITEEFEAGDFDKARTCFFTAALLKPAITGLHDPVSPPREKFDRIPLSLP